MAMAYLTLSPGEKLLHVSLGSLIVLCISRVLPDAATTLQQWQDLAAFPAGEDTDALRSLPLGSSVQGVQFRLLQLEHGGGGCNCWYLL